MTGGNRARFEKRTRSKKPRLDIAFLSPSHTPYAEWMLFEKYWMHH